ncbi:unnamed protein product [Prorocentrum cordatum]|uniref:short-chain 2-methylacyl-CoA dehydrogenase n=1 Tax=Prorocentrum cordatum TaxID=2364126 RepID=A0ABN9V3Y8_9DINO|nr:unnamed protein product [Polarella glacialis]
MLRDSVAQFAREVISPRTQAMDEAGQMDADIIQACFEQGIMGVEVPTEHGGVGLGFTAACLAVEEIAKVDAAVAAMIDIHNTLLVRAFMEYGNEEQRDTWLPRLASDTLAAFCISEPGSGSDAFALQTRAVRDGDDWVIDGGKCWISNAMEAGVFVVFANADPSKGHKGITAFVVEKGNPGLQIGKKENKLGIRASSTCELVFEGMRVPGNAVLGEVGQGYKIAISLLNEGRIGIAAQMVGLASGAFDYAMGYMVTRTKQFGQVVADFQGMQFQYARARMEIEAARCLVYNAARLKENGKPFVMEAAMAKLKASEVAQSVTSEAIDWLGGVGFTKEFLAEKYYRDSKIGTIYEGDEPATSSLPPSRRSSGEATTDGAAPRPSAPTRLAHASARRSAVRRAHAQSSCLGAPFSWPARSGSRLLGQRCTNAPGEAAACACFRRRNTDPPPPRSPPPSPVPSRPPARHRGRNVPGASRGAPERSSSRAEKGHPGPTVGVCGAAQGVY